MSPPPPPPPPPQPPPSTRRLRGGSSLPRQQETPETLPPNGPVPSLSPLHHMYQPLRADTAGTPLAPLPDGSPPALTGVGLSPPVSPLGSPAIRSSFRRGDGNHAPPSPVRFADTNTRSARREGSWRLASLDSAKGRRAASPPPNPLVETFPRFETPSQHDARRERDSLDTLSRRERPAAHSVGPEGEGVRAPDSTTGPVKHPPPAPAGDEAGVGHVSPERGPQREAQEAGAHVYCPVHPLLLLLWALSLYFFVLLLIPDTRPASGASIALWWIGWCSLNVLLTIKTYPAVRGFCTGRKSRVT